MSSADDPKRVCPKCRQIDKTSFSKCRFCGTKYEDEKKPGDKSDNGSALAVPTIMYLVFAVVGLGGFAYYQITHTVYEYAHPDKLIGRSFSCVGRYAVGAPIKQDLISYNTAMAEARKHDPHGGRGFDGIQSAATALDALNNDKDNSFSLAYKYAASGKLVLVRSGNVDSPVSVQVVGAQNSDTDPLVEVKVLNGPQVGRLYWMNEDRLELMKK